MPLPLGKGIISFYIMEFRLKVDISKTSIITPTDRMLFVGSCFAENIGRRFVDNQFDAVVNPYGTMYNPASVLHSVERALEDGTIGDKGVDVAIFTLGTNHVYILKETGEIVDNCMKRPQKLFREEELTVDECADYLSKAVWLLKAKNPNVKVVFTVSPIRYAKYGFHGSQLSKATLLLAVDKLVKHSDDELYYFPAYEIMNDELRDYRFYQADMLHPSEQAVDYIYELFSEAYFSEKAKEMVCEWQPIKAALAHRPFNPDSEEHKAFVVRTMAQKDAFLDKWKK